MSNVLEVQSPVHFNSQPWSWLCYSIGMALDKFLHLSVKETSGTK